MGRNFILGYTDRNRMDRSDRYRQTPKKRTKLQRNTNYCFLDRIGTFRDLRGGKSSASVRIYGTEGMIEAESSGYKPLVDEIVRFFKTGEVPVSAEETIEIYAFMSAADASKSQDGAAVSLAELIEKARKRNVERRSQKTRLK